MRQAKSLAGVTASEDGEASRAGPMSGADYAFECVSFCPVIDLNSTPSLRLGHSRKGMLFWRRARAFCGRNVDVRKASISNSPNGQEPIRR